MKAIISNNTIVLHEDSETINISKSTHSDLFKQVSQWIKDGEENKIRENFASIKNQIETYSKGELCLENDTLYDKVTGEQLPVEVARKFKSLKEEGFDYLSFSRFWSKLRQNPSEDSKKDLYAFMQHNDISITELGDIVLEKGIVELGDGRLVDAHTRTFDNSIGMVVEIPRKDVDPDRKKTCSYGLHVGAPKYVRDFYSDKIIVTCIVNPKDVVTVPLDYNNTKMRVCRYQVIGISERSDKTPAMIKLEDIISYPVKKNNISKNLNITIPETEVDLIKLTAQKIIDYVKEQTGIIIDKSLKNKKGILKDAVKILAEVKKEKSLKVTGLSFKEIVVLVKEVLKSDLVGSLEKKYPRRGMFLTKIKPVLLDKGYLLVD